MRSSVLVPLAGILGLLLWVAACGGRSGPATRNPVMPPDRAAGTEPDRAGDRAPEEPGRDTGALPLTEAECETLLAHVIGLANAAHVQDLPPEEVPTEEQIADIRARLAPRFIPACLALDRAAFECEMHAQSKDQLLACTDDR